MTELLDQVIARVRARSPETQDAVACVLLRVADDVEPVCRRTTEGEASFAASRAQAARRKFASVERIRAI